MYKSILKSFKTNKGGVKLSVNGYIYEKNNSYKNKIYWICEQRRNSDYKCTSRLITTLTETQEHMCLSNEIKEHNHEPNALRQKVQLVINNLKEDAKSNLYKKPCHIISDCEANTSSSVLSHLPTNKNLRQTIYRQRKNMFKVNEPEDINFEFLKENLNIPNDLEIVIIDKKYEKNRRIIIFSTDNFLKYLCLSKYIIMDGTFKVVPNIFQQLYTIHGCINDSQTFPLVLALCTNKDKNSYSLLFTTIIEYCESISMHLSPRYIIMDFEKTAHICAKQLFENAAIKGCNFHLGQIIYRKIQKEGYQTLYGNDENFAIEIKSLLALAYLPHNEIPIFFDDLQENLSSEAGEIAAWFSRYYIWGTANSPPNFAPQVWSTFELEQDNIPRTQNSAESWHNRFAHFVGQNHPGFYLLSRKIILEIKHQSAEIDKLLIGAPPPTKKKKYLNKINRIDVILHNKSNYVSKSDFLKALAANLNLF